jgi:hypothetical protein
VHDAGPAFPGRAAQFDRHADPPAPGPSGLRTTAQTTTPTPSSSTTSRTGARTASAIHAGPAEGSTANFLSLTCRADIDADYFAYADQDDVWESDKLERAVNWLKTIPEGVPALYGSRTLLVDARNQHIGYSPLFEREPNFRNALVQSIAGGNTMVFNRAARDLLRRRAKTSKPSHTTGGPTCW